MSRNSEAKLALIREMCGDEPDVAEVLRLGRLSLKKLLREATAKARREAAAQRAWERRRCRCGKLNRNCGELLHQIEPIDSIDTPLFDSLPKAKAPGVVHAWLVEEGKTP